MNPPPVARHQGEAETSTYARASTVRRRLQAVILALDVEVILTPPRIFK